MAAFLLCIIFAIYAFDRKREDGDFTGDGRSDDLEYCNEGII